MDRLELMQTFVLVAEARGFAAAARRLRRSPPAVTRAVAALEARLGVELLHRTTREVRLTEAGARLLPEAKRILADVAEVESSIAGDAEPRGTLSVTAPSMFGRLHVAPVLLEYRARYPKVQVRFVVADRLVSLADEGIDVAVRIAKLDQPAAMAVRVGAVRRVLSASPDYLARRGVPRHPRELAGHDVIGFSTTGDHAPFRFVIRGRVQTVEVRPALIVNDNDVSLAAALGGHGIAAALSYQVAAHVRAGKLQVVLADFEPEPIPVHVIHREGRHPSARVRAFVDLATEALKRAQPAFDLTPVGPSPTVRATARGRSGRATPSRRAPRGR